MTLNTLDFLVQPAEGIAGLIVVKFGDGADGLPTGGSVTIFARKVERAVRILRNWKLRRTSRALRQGLEC